MTKIKEIFQQRQRTYSFELFPPRTDQGSRNLLNTITELAALKPDFISCTYGAGGGSRDKTRCGPAHPGQTYGVTGLAHLTCVLHTKEEIKNILRDIRSRGIENVLALRGDSPRENPDWEPGKDNFHYSSELCAFIREHFGEYFTIGVAGFPEGHLCARTAARTPNI